MLLFHNRAAGVSLYAVQPLHSWANATTVETNAPAPSARSAKRSMTAEYMLAYARSAARIEGTSVLVVQELPPGDDGLAVTDRMCLLLMRSMFSGCV